MASLQHGSVMRTPLKCVSFYKSEDQSSCEMLKIQTEKLLMTQPVARKHMRDQFKALRVATTTTESPAENVGHLGKPGGKSIFLGIKGRIAGREESPHKIITAIENQEIPPSKSRILVPSWKSWILIVLELDSNTF